MLQEVVSGVSKGGMIVKQSRNSNTNPSNQANNLLRKYGLGQERSSDARCISFSNYDRLPVSNTCFEHPKGRLLT